MRLGTTAAAALIASGAGWITARMVRTRGRAAMGRSGGVDYITGEKGGYPHFGEEKTGGAKKESAGAFHGGARTEH